MNILRSKIIVLWGVSILLLTFCVSCGGDLRPEGMPKLYPATVTVLQENKGLDNAIVTLINEDTTQSKWLVGGRTNSSGTCNILTQGKFNGAPLGKYKVLVTKTEKIESETAKKPVPQDDNAATEYYAKIHAEEKFYERVIEKYKEPETSDLEIEITKDKNEKTFDVGEAVKIEIKLVE
jgi:hypothetical protein